MIRLRLGHHQTLDDAEADAAQAEDGRCGARPHFSRIQHRADAGGDAAAEQADLVEGRRRIDFRQGDFRQHGVFRKRRGAHVVQNGFAAHREARGAVRHDAFSLREPDGAAKIGPSRQAKLTLAALGNIQRNHMIAGLNAGHAGADFQHRGAAFMAHDRRKQSFGVFSGKRVGIGVADTGGGDFQ